MNKIIIYGLVILAVVGLIYWFMPKNNYSLPENQATGNQAPSSGGTTYKPAPKPAGKLFVDIKGFAFTPNFPKIPVGTTVTWKNDDPTFHSVIGSDFNSGTLGQGQSYSHTFTKPGTYTYYCGFHPASMKGTILVQ